VVVASTSIGQKVLEGVSDAAKAVQRIKALTVDLAINSAQKALRTEALAKAAGRMADAVAKLPFGNGKTVGEVINSYVDRLDIIHDELAKIGKPLDDFGVKAQAQLAKLLDTDLGYFPGEKALRGFMRATPELVDRSGNVQLVYEALFKDDTGALDKAALVSDLEKITDAAEPFYIIGSADSPRVAWQINVNNVIRSESDAITIALNNGVSIPADVEIIFVPEGFCGPDVNAFYIGFSKEKNPSILWQDFYNNGKIKVKVDRRILNSDESIVAVLGHEMYEIDALRQIFASSPAAMQYMDVARLIDAKLGGTIHQQAWDYADNLVLDMRAQ
jgi:hypothetical protein